MILALLLAAATSAPAPLTVTITPTASQDALHPGWLSDLNADLCARAQQPVNCTTEDIHKATGRTDLRIFATREEWATMVLEQAFAAAAQQQAIKLRSVAEGDAATLKAAARKELGLPEGEKP